MTIARTGPNMLRKGAHILVESAALYAVVQLAYFILVVLGSQAFTPVCSAVRIHLRPVLLTNSVADFYVQISQLVQVIGICFEWIIIRAHSPPVVQVAPPSFQDISLNLANLCPDDIERPFGVSTEQNLERSDRWLSPPQAI
jgi:hypothetical protein